MVYTAGNYMKAMTGPNSKAKNILNTGKKKSLAKKGRKRTFNPKG